MAVQRKRIPRYSTVEINGHIYYRTTVTGAEGNRISLYGKTREELYDKEIKTLDNIDDASSLSITTYQHSVFMRSVIATPAL